MKNSSILSKSALSFLTPLIFSLSASALECGTPAHFTHPVPSSTVVVVSIKMDGRANYCTGSIISKNQILTSASCLKNSASALVVFSQSFQDTALQIQSGLPIDLDNFKLKTLTRNVVRQHVHLDYDGTPATNSADLAVVETDQDVPPNYRPIALAENDAALNPILGTQALFAFGFAGTPITPGNLYQQSFTVDQSSAVTSPILLSSDKLAAACQTGAQLADAGGPIVAFRNETPLVDAVQIGIITPNLDPSLSRAARVSQDLIKNKILVQPIAVGTPINYKLIQTTGAVCLNCHSTMFKNIETTKKKIKGIVALTSIDQMPPADDGYAPLTACQKATLKKWLELGTPAESTVTQESLPECQNP